MAINTRNHGILLGILLAFLIAPFIFPETPLDGLILCPLRAATGVECAGCGMTRSWVALTHGHVVDSLHFHPLGLFLYLLAAIKALLLIAELRLGRRLETPRLQKLRTPTMALLFVAFVTLAIVRASDFLIGA